MQNAWLLYRMSAAARTLPLTQLQFRREICKVYLAKYGTSVVDIPRSLPAHRTACIQRRCPNDVRFDGTEHFIGRNPTQLRCAVCGKKVYKKCLKCNIGVHVECFSKFHTK
jgi:hypothetical protein